MNAGFEDGEAIEREWTSLRIATGHETSLEKITTVMIDQLFCHLSMFEQEGFAAFLPAWKSRDALQNQEIALQYNGDIIEGLCVGIYVHGQLLVETKSQGVMCFAAGEVSLKPFYSL